MKKSLKLFLQLLLWLPLCAGAQTVSTFLPPGSGIDDALLLDSAGNLYGSGYASGNVYKVTPSGSVSIFASGLSSSNGLAWDGHGNLAVCDNTGDGIYKIAPDSTISLFLPIAGPSGMIKDPLSDTLYFTTYPGQQVLKVAPDTSIHPFLQGNGLSGPVGLAWDDANRLLISNFSNGAVFRADRSGNFSQIGQFPVGVVGFIAFRQGYIYGTMFNNQRIFRMDTLGNTEWVAGSVYGQMDGPAATARFSRPNGIIFSRGGDSLIISDYASQAIRIVTGLDSVGIVSTEHPMPMLEALEVAPNPSEGRFRVRFNLQADQPVSVRVLDLQGRAVLEIPLQYFGPGQHAQDLDASALPRGVYMLELEAGDTRLCRKIVLQ